MISRTARYALRAVLFIAEHEGEGFVSVREMTEELDVPQNYLSKTLHRLAGAGVLRSVRGPRGGFRLVAPPAELRLERILEAVDPLEGTDKRCLLGRAECSVEEPCAAHGRWCHVRETVEAFFSETTVADLIGAGRAVSP